MPSIFSAASKRGSQLSIEETKKRRNGTSSKRSSSAQRRVNCSPWKDFCSSAILLPSRRFSRLQTGLERLLRFSFYGSSKTARLPMILERLKRSIDGSTRENRRSSPSGLTSTWPNGG